MGHRRLAIDEENCILKVFSLKCMVKSTHESAVPSKKPMHETYWF